MWVLGWSQVSLVLLQWLCEYMCVAVPTLHWLVHENNYLRRGILSSNTNWCSCVANYLWWMLRPIHMGTAMRIKCASNPVCRVHIKSDTHHVQSTLGGGFHGSGFKLDCNIIHDSREVVPTVGFLAWLLAWLVAHVVSVLLLQQCWGRKRFILWWLRRVVQRGKIK